MVFGFFDGKRGRPIRRVIQTKIIELMRRLGEAVKANPAIAERNVVIEARDRRKVYTTDIEVDFDDNSDFVIYEVAGSKAY